MLTEISNIQLGEKDLTLYAASVHNFHLSAPLLKRAFWGHFGNSGPIFLDHVIFEGRFEPG